jgi:hypothetical protein
MISLVKRTKDVPINGTAVKREKSSKLKMFNAPFAKRKVAVSKIKHPVTVNFDLILLSKK